MGQSPQAQLGTHWRRRWLLEIDEKVNSRQHSFPSPRQTQWFVVPIRSKSPMEMGTHWLRLADRHWRSCKISHAVKRKGHFDRSSDFEAQNPVRVANHSKTDVFFFMVVCHMKSSCRHSETRIFKKSWAGARSAGFTTKISQCVYQL